MKDSILVKLQAVGCEMFLENFLAQKKTFEQTWNRGKQCQNAWKGKYTSKHLPHKFQAN